MVIVFKLRLQRRARRPPTGLRIPPGPPGTSGGKSYGPPGSARPPPATAKVYGAAGAAKGFVGAGVPGSASGRPGSRSMIPGTAGGVLSAQVRISDRPVTQQGLSGLKTASSQGPNRQVLDRSYYLGLLRSKTQELSIELNSMNAENDAFNQDNATFLSFERRAEGLANEIKELRGEMADYNTLMDKLNTDTEIDDIVATCETLSRKNEQEARDIDTIFSRKREKETELEAVLSEIERKKKSFDDMISSMDEEDLKRYETLKENNAKITKDLQEGQDILDSLTSKIQQQTDELSQNYVKQEALQLRHQLTQARTYLEELKKQDEETPQQEQERLLRQVKADNQEIVSLEKKCAELQEQLASVQNQLQQVNYDLSHLHGERSEQYKDLKVKEAAMKDFFEAFENNCLGEKKKISIFESDVAVVLDHISQNIAQSEHMPSIEEYEEMQASLGFKQDELSKTKATSRALDEENAKLQADLRKVEDLESKISKELDQLKTNMDTMSTELVTFCDLDGLHASEDKKAKLLTKERGYLTQRSDELVKGIKTLSENYEKALSKLNENDTFCQLNNLEHKWQHHEQNNFGMKEFISAKRTESNYVQVSKEVHAMVAEYNKMLCSSVAV